MERRGSGWSPWDQPQDEAFVVCSHSLSSATVWELWGPPRQPGESCCLFPRCPGQGCAVCPLLLAPLWECLWVLGCFLEGGGLSLA